MVIIEDSQVCIQSQFLLVFRVATNGCHVTSVAEDSTADDEPLAFNLVDRGPFVHVAGLEPEQTGYGSADPLARKGKGAKNKTCKKPLPDLGILCLSFILQFMYPSNCHLRFR